MMISIVTLSILPFSILRFSIMTCSIMTLSIKGLIVTLGTMAHSITMLSYCAECCISFNTMLNVNMLSVVVP